MKKILKIIILPNKIICPIGKLIKLSNFLNLNLLNILLNNFINLPSYCGGFGKCTSCQILLNNGLLNEKDEFLKINKKYYLSCQVYLNNNIIISIPN